MTRLPSSAPLLAGLMLAALLSGCGQNDGAAGGAPNRPEVSVVTLHPQSVAITAELPGRTTASLTAEVRPQVGGLIQKRLFTEGGEVKAGDPLYQIDPASYRASLDSAEAALKKAEAAVPSAKAKLERYQQLVKQSAVSKQDFDDASASYDEAVADVASAKASVDTARINLDYTTLTAPIGGRIDKSSLTPGALVTASQTTALTTIRTLDPMFVDVTQSSTNLLNLREAIAAGRVKLSGANVTVRLKLENGTTYDQPGRLEFRESYVDESTGTYGLRATFPNPERLLLPGMYVRAVIEEGVAQNSFLVPQRAVSHNTKGEATAWFVTAQGKAEQRVITVRSSVGNNWLVDAGVSNGDRIVVEGTQLIRAGAEVSPVEVIIDDTTGEVREHKEGVISPDQQPAGTIRPAKAG
ncbi:hemolysin D [Azorhizobium oxalatiphilum]|uniref:Hemolysin D n=1 Tax=Azorhizobium oxalatiphilum TaxID=980631 RepID=A0A917C679_9HYPH|nr:efflux RND transporter periplasmic adaptor subunit [Azorhizobium oxalatiphilum]GGF73911.1 hemolysin D [Azorhizobium oxalatiphilum]